MHKGENPNNKAILLMEASLKLRRNYSARSVLCEKLRSADWHVCAEPTYIVFSLDMMLVKSKQNFILTLSRAVSYSNLNGKSADETIKYTHQSPVICFKSYMQDKRP